MVNKRMKSQAVLKLARKAARKEGYSIVEMPGRGKGSHRTFQVLDGEGAELGRFQVTSHGNKDVSWGVLRDIEDRLEHVFGGKWMEEK